MKLKTKLASILALSIVLISGNAYASNREKDTYIYGAGLNDNQIQEVAHTLKIDTDTTLNDNVGGDDTEKYLGYRANDYDMISSVVVKKMPKGSGISIEILTPDKITEITESQYVNAAITAGVDDIDIKVASPKPVTGESALTGVYKAIELNGEKVDTQRSEVAQDELSTVNEINQENKQKDGFDAKKLDDVIIDVKQELQKYKEENGEKADSENLREIVINTVNNYNLGDILSNNNIESLIDYFNKYQNTDAVDSDKVMENLNNLKDTLTQKGQEIYEDNKSDIDNAYNKAKESGIFDKIKEFFINLVNEIKAMF